MKLLCSTFFMSMHECIIHASQVYWNEMKWSDPVKSFYADDACITCIKSFHKKIMIALNFCLTRWLFFCVAWKNYFLKTTLGYPLITWVLRSNSRVLRVYLQCCLKNDFCPYDWWCKHHKAYGIKILLLLCLHSNDNIFISNAYDASSIYLTG